MAEPESKLFVCSNHLDLQSLWRCVSCNNYLCDQCIEIVGEGRRKFEVCRACRDRVVLAKSEQQEILPWSKQIYSAFSYPFRGRGIVMLITGVLFIEILFHLAGSAGGIFALFFVLLAGGFLSTSILKIISSSTAGEDEAPDLFDISDLSDLWSGYLRPLFLILGTVLFSFGPAILYNQYLSHKDSPTIIPWILGVWGVLYMPMGLLVIGISENLRTLNPILVISSIFKTFGNYLVTCVLFVVIYFLFLFVREFAGDLIPFAGTFITDCLSFYLLMVGMRVLGLLYVSNKAQLVWF